MSQGYPVVTCDACLSRNDAEALRGVAVWVSAHRVKIDDQHEYLWSDLVGRAVVDSDQAVVGTILRVCNYGSADIVVLGHEQKGELEIPFVATYFDMNFKRGDGQLLMVVSGATFAGLWSSEAACT